MKTVADRIAYLNPCLEALEWAEGYTNPTEAWEKCRQGSWMLWLLGKLSGPPLGEGRKKLVLASCLCARQALVFAKDIRVLACIEATEGWAVGSVSLLSLKEVKDNIASAAYTAYAAACVADASDADGAAYAAACVADASDAADDAANAAAFVAGAADAAYAIRSLSLSADNVRSVYPDPPYLEL